MLLRDRLRDLGQRQQCRLGAHFETFAVCMTRKLAGSRSNGSVPAIAAKPSNAGPMEWAMRAAASASTGTPATSAIALISLGVGFVMRRLLLLMARGCGPIPQWPCSTQPDVPFYRARPALVWHLRRAAPRTGNGCETGSPRADRSDWADRPISAGFRSADRDPTTASLPATPAYRDAPARPTPGRPDRARPLRRDTSPAPDRKCSAPR